MALRIVRLGSPRAPGEGLRLGTVRRPPRGVPRAEYAARDFYDVWLPVLAPSAGLMAEGRAAATDREWATFASRFRREMSRSDAAGVLDLLAVLSGQLDVSLGCYCEHRERCHRSVLADLLAERGAALA